MRCIMAGYNFWYIIALTEKLQDILSPLAYLCSINKVNSDFFYILLDVSREYLEVSFIFSY